MLSVVERLAGCMMYIKEAMYISQCSMMYIKEAMYISQCSTCGASLALVALGCLSAYRIPWCRVMATHHRGTPTTTVYLSTTTLNSGTYLCVCRVMATSPHRDVHQQYVTEFRYMSLSCQYPSLTQSQSTQGAISYHHLLPYYCTKNLTVLERSDLGLYTTLVVVALLTYIMN